MLLALQGMLRDHSDNNAIVGAMQWGVNSFHTNIQVDDECILPKPPCLLPYQTYVSAVCSL